MSFDYKLHSEAVTEYADAYKWYELQQKGLGEKFIAAIDRHVIQICNNPEYYSKTGKYYRQVAVDGFPFVIVYQYFPQKAFVHITAIHHYRKHPRKKYRKQE